MGTKGKIRRPQAPKLRSWQYLEARGRFIRALDNTGCRGGGIQVPFVALESLLMGYRPVYSVATIV